MTQPMEYLKLIGKLPEYSGNDDVNGATDWLSTIKMYKSFFPENMNEKLFLTAVSSSLKDKAGNWWCIKGNELNSWSAFEKAFEEKFVTEDRRPRLA